MGTQRDGPLGDACVPSSCSELRVGDADTRCLSAGDDALFVRALWRAGICDNAFRGIVSRRSSPVTIGNFHFIQLGCAPQIYTEGDVVSTSFGVTAGRWHDTAVIVDARRTTFVVDGMLHGGNGNARVFGDAVVLHRAQRMAARLVVGRADGVTVTVGLADAAGVGVYAAVRDQSLTFRVVDAGGVLLEDTATLSDESGLLGLALVVEPDGVRLLVDEPIRRCSSNGCARLQGESPWSAGATVRPQWQASGTPTSTVATLRSITVVPGGG